MKDVSKKRISSVKSGLKAKPSLRTKSRRASQFKRLSRASLQVTLEAKNLIHEILRRYPDAKNNPEIRGILEQISHLYEIETALDPVEDLINRINDEKQSLDLRERLAAIATQLRVAQEKKDQEPSDHHPELHVEFRHSDEVEHEKETIQEVEQPSTLTQDPVQPE